jgi:hypothetical protein
VVVLLDVQTRELRTDLINLLERSQEHLTPKQSSEVKRLLKEYEGLFAASDSDYGRTNVVKHKIATGSAHPNRTDLCHNISRINNLSVR